MFRESIIKSKERIAPGHLQELLRRLNIRHFRNALVVCDDHSGNYAFTSLQGDMVCTIDQLDKYHVRVEKPSGEWQKWVAYVTRDFLAVALGADVRNDGDVMETVPRVRFPRYGGWLRHRFRNYQYRDEIRKEAMQSHLDECPQEFKQKEDLDEETPDLPQGQDTSDQTKETKRAEEQTDPETD